MSINDRISSVKNALKKSRLDAYIISSSDPHQSEYVADHWKTREWISGFTGSAGIVVITPDHAGLWTDGRYFLQAETELQNTGMVLHKQKVQGAPEYVDWLKENLKEGDTVAFDGKCFSVSQVESLKKTLGSAGIKIDGELDLAESLWKDRTDLPTNKVFEFQINYAGKSRLEKLDLIRKEMQEAGVSHYLITTLDDLAWTFNIRSNDVEYNPVSIAYAVITQTNVILFIDQNKVPKELSSKFVLENIEIQAYNQLIPYLHTLAPGQKLWIDNTTCSYWISNQIKDEQKYFGSNIPKVLKAIKNPVEIKNLKSAMIQDGVSLTKAFIWLKNELKKRTVTEVQLAEKIQAFRSEHRDYVGESFAAIVGYASNGAIIHYHPKPESCAVIQNEGILLVDCGAQYKSGTTDITRTIALSKPSKEHKLQYTMVLRGHINLARAKFLYGTRGVQLDILARLPLWSHGLNFSHGTGHGVGFFMNVHEPPQGFIAGLGERGTTVFEPGMLTSNEPGFYEEGSHGIRIENLVLTVENETTAYGRFLSFDTVSLFPIDTKLVDAKLMNNEEIKWLNKYHDHVYKKLSPFLNSNELKWLKKHCQHIH